MHTLVCILLFISWDYLKLILFPLAASAVYQSGMYALAAKLPEGYTQSYIVGQVIITILVDHRFRGVRG